jgi:hypothetical protein
MATAQALGMDMSALFGGRKLPAPAAVQPEGNPPADEQPPDDLPPENTTANLAAEAAAGEEPDFPEEPAGPGAAQEETEFMRLNHTLDQIMTSYKTELNVVSKNGRNPYKLAEDEFKNPAATEETHRVMIGRLMNYLKEKGINV